MFSPKLIDIGVMVGSEFIRMIVVFGTELITVGFLNAYCRLDVAGCLYLFSQECLLCTRE